MISIKGYRLTEAWLLPWWMILTMIDLRCASLDHLISGTTDWSSHVVSGEEAYVQFVFPLLTVFKVAWSAMVSCSDLLENDIKCVYWQDNPTCQVSNVIQNPHWLTACKVFGTQPIKFPIFAIFLKAWLIYKSSFKGFVSLGWTWFLFCLFAKIPR